MINATAVAESLPELGDSAQRLLTPQKERLLGQRLINQVGQQSRLVDDYFALDYLRQLTARVAIHSPRPIGHFKIYLLDAPSINAFALPDNHFVFHTGLLTTTRNAAELASVVAHELAHQSQRHIPRMLERAQERSLPAAAAIIGGILIGGQAGVATIASANAAVLSDQLSYNRSFEKEADSTGIEMLHAAGYPPSAMADFFAELERQARISGSQIPEFLRTHPLSSHRVTDSRAKANSLLARHTIKGDAPAKDLVFALIRARITARFNRSTQTEETFKRHLVSVDSHSQLSSTYGLANLLFERGQYDQALETLDKYAPATTPSQATHTLISALRAEILLSMGNTHQAHQILAPIIEAPRSEPFSLPVRLLAAEIDRAAGQAAKAVRTLRQLNRDTPQPHWVYPALIRATAEAGQATEAALLDIEYRLMAGEIAQAEARLDTVLARKDTLTTYEQARIENLAQRVQALKREIEEFKL